MKPHARRPAPPITDEDEARIQAGIAQDPDNPELTDEQLAAMRPASEVLPATLLESLTRRPGHRGAGRKPSKVQLTLRLDPEALAAWRASGEGWQTRMVDLLASNAPKTKRRA